MRQPHFLSILVFFLLMSSIALYQNCSEPIENIGIQGPNPDPDCEVTNSCATGASNTLGAVNSLTLNGTEIFEVGLNQDYHTKLTGFTGARDIFACAQFYRGLDTWCPTEYYREISNDTNFSYSNGIGRTTAQACTLSNCTFFSHSTYYGSTFQIEYVNSNFTKKVKKRLYILPPHLSPNYTEAAVWYTNDSAGRDRIIHWLQGQQVSDKLTSYLTPNQPFYSHWFKPPGVAVVQVCIKTFTGNSVPAPSACAAAEWVNAVRENTIVASDGKHHYNYNSSGFGAGRYVAFLRNAANQQVYSYATTVIVVE